jgi:hypothetical protein
LYAEAYVALKDVYTARDSRSVSSWMMARLSGVPKRNKYTEHGHKLRILKIRDNIIKIEKVVKRLRND